MAEAGIINRSYLSSTTFLDQREILKQVLDVEDNESFLDLMDVMGRSTPTSQVTYRHFVNSDLYASAEVQNDPAGGNAGDVFSVDLVQSAIQPIVGEIMMTKDGKRALVTAITNDANNTINVKALETIAEGDIETGDTVVFFTNAYGEGTGSNLMRKSDLTATSNNVQIFKTKTSITDLAAGSKIEVEYKGKPYYFLKQQHDAFLKHRMDVQYGMLYGIGGSTTDASGNTVNMTKGLHEYIKGGGVQQTVANAGTVALATDLNNLSRKLDKARAGAEYIILAGGEADNAIDLGIATADMFKSGGVQYGAFNGSEEQAVKLGFESFRIFGRTFHKKRLQALDNGNVVNPVDAFKFDSYAYLIPSNGVKVEHGGGVVDRISTRYMELHDGSTTRYREKLLGGLAPTPTSDTDTLDIVYTSIEGLSVVGVDHFGWLYVNG